MSEVINPFQSPRAELILPAEPRHELTLLAEPRALSAGSAFTWIKEGWALYKQNKALWILLVLIGFFAPIVFELAPVIGPIFSICFTVVFSAGLLWGVQQTAYQGTFGFKDIGVIFGDNKKSGTLLLLYLINILCFGLVLLFILSPMIIMESLGIVADQGTKDTLTTIMLTLGALLFLIVLMLFWFTTTLVTLHNASLLQALRLSFQGAWRNILPLILYILTLVVLGILGTIPVLLGWFVVIPLYFCSWYAAYRQIYLS